MDQATEHSNAINQIEQGECNDSMEVASQPQVDAHLLLELAHFNPYFLVKVVSPHQIPLGMMTTALQLAIVREMGGYKYVQWDYEEYTHDMRYRAPMEMEGTEWPEENAVNLAWRNTPGPWIYRDEYLEVKGYKNGNAHVHFLRPDLVDKMNALIAEHYGANSLPDGM